MNSCPVCKPYGKPGYQDQVDGPAIPCYGCNRSEFEKYALGKTQKQPRYEDENGKLWDHNPATGEWDIPIECAQPERDLALLKVYDEAVRDLLKAAREASRDCDGIPDLDVAITRLDLLLRDEPGDARANQLDDDSCRTCGGPAMKCGHSPEAAYYHGPDDYGCSLCEAEDK